MPAFRQSVDDIRRVLRRWIVFVALTVAILPPLTTASLSWQEHNVGWELTVVTLMSTGLGLMVYVLGHGLMLRTINALLGEVQAAHQAVWQRSIQLTSASLNLDMAYRAAEQTQEELRAALARAEGANRAKSEFLAAVSHELRTPLNAIIGFSEIIRNEMFGPLGNTRYAAYAHDINDSGTLLLRLINEILDMVKLADGSHRLQMGDVSPACLVEGCINAIRPEAERRGIDVVFDVIGAMYPVRGDAGKLRQAVNCLLGNAVKFTSNGGRVAVTLAPDVADGALCITIDDTGEGMTAAELAEARQPFRQADNSLGRRHGGLGLGLPLARGLVELHGGTLDIDSEKGKGTCVQVRLPLQVAAAPALTAAA
jgi:signal transduction histidine kinase